MYYFIFDLDETLYQTDNNDNNTDNNNNNIETINHIDIEKLEKINKIGKLILFSNATNKHCMEWLDILNIKQYFSVIISCNTFNMYKPNPNLYDRVIKYCGIDSSKDSVFFFDDLPINLLTGYQKGWKTILISPIFNKKHKNKLKDNHNYIDYNFKNINLSLEHILFYTFDL